MLITCASCLLVSCLKHKCHIFAVQKKKSNCYVLRCKDVLCKQRKKRIFLKNKNVVCYVNLIELSIKRKMIQTRGLCVNLYRKLLIITYNTLWLSGLGIYMQSNSFPGTGCKEY